MADRKSADTLEFSADSEIADAESAYGFAPGLLVDGKYELSHEIGRGAMGQVWLALDRALDRDVAIKLLGAQVTADPSFRGRFVTEARAMAKVRHENVVSIHAFGELDGQPYFVMEFVPGRSLSDWLATAGILAPDEALGILRQVCSGVHAIHGAGAVHRDLKPANILIGPGFRVAVADLGLARMLQGKASGTFGTAGTPDYMAPEQILGQQLAPALAPRTDVYQLGVLAFELFIGQMPFTGDSVMEVLAQHTSATPPAPSSLRDDLSTAFDGVILAALSKAPIDRPASAMGFFQALESARTSVAAPMRAQRILIADDDAEFLEFARCAVADALPQATLILARDGAEAYRAIRDPGCDLALLDLDMPEMSAMEIVAALASEPTAPRVVVMTAVGGAADWKVLAGLGADAFLLKPLTAETLATAARRSLGLSVEP